MSNLKLEDRRVIKFPTKEGQQIKTIRENMVVVYGNVAKWKFHEIIWKHLKTIATYCLKLWPMTRIGYTTGTLKQILNQSNGFSKDFQHQKGYERNHLSENWWQSPFGTLGASFLLNTYSRQLYHHSPKNLRKAINEKRPMLTNREVFLLHINVT